MNTKIEGFLMGWQNAIDGARRRGFVKLKLEGGGESEIEVTSLDELSALSEILHSGGNVYFDDEQRLLETGWQHCNVQLAPRSMLTAVQEMQPSVSAGKDTDDLALACRPTLFGWSRLSRFSLAAGHFVFLEEAIYFGLGGWGFDCIKPLFYHDFEPLRRFGIHLYGDYFLFNIFALILAVSVSQLPRRRYLRFLLFGMCLWLAGIVNVIVIEPSMMQIVWHGIFGFIAAVTVGFNQGAQDILTSWKSYTSSAGTPSYLDVRKELQKEKQWHLQLLSRLWWASRRFLACR